VVWGSGSKYLERRRAVKGRPQVRLEKTRKPSKKKRFRLEGVDRLPKQDHQVNTLPPRGGSGPRILKAWVLRLKRRLFNILWEA